MTKHIRQPSVTAFEMTSQTLVIESQPYRPVACKKCSRHDASFDAPRQAFSVVKQRTATHRFSRTVRSIDSWCEANGHLSIPEQKQKLNEKMRGNYAYYVVTGNSEAILSFLWEVQRHGQKGLFRRNRLRSLNWSMYRKWLQRL